MGRLAGRPRCPAAYEPYQPPLNALGNWDVSYELSSFQTAVRCFVHEDAETAVQLGCGRCDRPQPQNQTAAYTTRLIRNKGHVVHVDLSPQRKVYPCPVGTVYY